MKLTVNEQNVPMNVFASRIVSNLGESLVGSLDRIPQNRENVTFRSGISAPVALEINGSEVELNDFVQKIFKNVLQGIVTSLDGVPASPDHIELTLR